MKSISSGTRSDATTRSDDSRVLGSSERLTSRHADQRRQACSLKMSDSFRTDRLVATRLHEADLSELCRMHQDAAVMSTLGGTRSEEQTKQYLRTNLAHWDEHGFGIWAFRAASDGAFVGRGGLRHVHIGGHDEVEVAYALMPEFWGRGLATEIARALLKIGFEQLALGQLVTFTLTTNQASRRVMEKVGFTLERELVHGARGLPHVLYRITCDSLGRLRERRC